jgi:ParB-like nuclease domain
MANPAITPLPSRAKRAHNWTDTVKELQARIAAGTTSAPDVTDLAISDLEIIEDVFQHRSGNQARSGQHIDSLVKSLRNRKGVALDPVVVFWVGDGWVLVDGHHRLNAYEEHGRTEPVPVTVFKGTLDEAICEALRGNSRDKLSMGRREKSEAAWRLVIGTSLRTFQIVESSTISKVTVYKMNKARDEIRQKWPETKLASLSWEDAQNYKGLASPEQQFDEEWQEKQSKDLANRLVRHFGSNLGKQPEILWRAIEIYNGRLAEQLKDWLGVAPEDYAPDF